MPYKSDTWPVAGPKNLAHTPAMTPVTSPVMTSPLRPANTPANWLLAALFFTLLWDASGADLAVMRSLGTAQGFAWRNDWLLERVLHEGLRQLCTGLFLLMVLWAVWPLRWEHPAGRWLLLPRRERLVLVLLVLCSLLAVSWIKSQSQTSCPWELQAFGGRAVYVSHWLLWQADGGTGRCFPGGHASSALGFLGLCLPWLSPPSGRMRLDDGNEAVAITPKVAGDLQAESEGTDLVAEPDHRDRATLDIAQSRQGVVVVLVPPEVITDSDVELERIGRERRREEPHGGQPDPVPPGQLDHRHRHHPVLVGPLVVRCVHGTGAERERPFRGRTALSRRASGHRRGRQAERNRWKHPAIG